MLLIVHGLFLFFFQMSSSEKLLVLRYYIESNPCIWLFLQTWRRSSCQMTMTKLTSYQ